MSLLGKLAKKIVPSLSSCVGALNSGVSGRVEIVSKAMKADKPGHREIGGNLYSRCFTETSFLLVTRTEPEWHRLAWGHRSLPHCPDPGIRLPVPCVSRAIRKYSGATALLLKALVAISGCSQSYQTCTSPPGYPKWLQGSSDLTLFDISPFLNNFCSPSRNLKAEVEKQLMTRWSKSC